MAPTLATSCAALPPEGANFPRGGPSGNVAPTLATSCAALDVLVPEALALRAVPMCAGTSGAAALSPKGSNLATPLFENPWGGPAGNCHLAPSKSSGVAA